MSTLSELSAQNKAAIESEINQTTPAVPAAFNDVISDIMAVAQKSIEKVVNKAELENLVKTATLREDGGKLNDIGEQQGVTYKYATAAVINVEIVAANGTEITPQYSLSGDSNGLDYIISASHIAAGGVISLPVTCTTAGATGNLSAGDTLTLSAPLAGAEQTATVISTETVGAAAEGIDSYRDRILDEIRNPGEAGNLSFYRKRGKEASGVAQIYPYRGLLSGSTFINPGDVSCYVEATTDIDPDGIPTQAVLDAAEQAIRYDSTGEIGKTPTTLRELHMFPITRPEIYFTITGLSIYDDSQLGDCRDDIESALGAALLALKPYITGLDYSKDKNNVLSVPYFSGLVDDVVKTYSGSYTGLLFGFSAASVSSVEITLTPGQLVKLGAIVYV